MKFNAMCQAGHVFLVREGSSLERRCRLRFQEGIAQTEAIRPEECDYCLRDAISNSILVDLTASHPSLMIAQGD